MEGRGEARVEGWSPSTPGEIDGEGVRTSRVRQERSVEIKKKTRTTLVIPRPPPRLGERRKRGERTRRAVPHSRWRDFIFPTHRPNKFTHTERETERGKSQERKIFVCIVLEVF